MAVVEPLDLPLVQVVVLEDVLKGLRNLPVDGVIDVRLAAPGDTCARLRVRVGRHLIRGLVLVRSDYLRCVAGIRVLFLLLFLLLVDKGIEPLECIYKLPG